MEVEVIFIVCILWFIDSEILFMDEKKEKMLIENGK